MNIFLWTSKYTYVTALSSLINNQLYSTVYIQYQEIEAEYQLFIKPIRNSWLVVHPASRTQSGKPAPSVHMHTPITYFVHKLRGTQLPLPVHTESMIHSPQRWTQPQRKMAAESKKICSQGRCYYTGVKPPLGTLATHVGVLVQAPVMLLQIQFSANMPGNDDGPSAWPPAT